MTIGRAGSFRLLIAGAVLLPLFSTSLEADKVYLSGGQCIEGTVTGDAENEVKVLLPSGITMGIPRGQVDRMEIETPPTPTPTPVGFGGPGVPIRIIERSEPNQQPGDATQPISSTGGQPLDLKTVLDTKGMSVSVPVEPRGERIGVCGKIMGQVQVREEDGTWRDLQTGEVIYKGQVFRALKGRARLVLTDGTEIGIAENSEGRVENQPGNRFELFRGRIWSQIREYSSAGEIKLTIKSPNAVAAVRGGLLRFDVSPQRIARITLFEGAAAVEEPAGEPTHLAPLRVAVVDPEGDITGFEEASVEERREWDEWDQWAEDLARETRHLGAGVGGAIIGEMARQIASEQKTYKRMVDERNRLVILNKEAEKLEFYADAVKRYYRDVGHFPPEDKAWQQLKYNLDEPGWNGPYISSDLMLPLKDRWGNEIHYFLRTNQQGTEYVEIISNGPNGIFEDGEPDADIKAVVPIPR